MSNRTTTEPLQSIDDFVEVFEAAIAGSDGRNKSPINVLDYFPSLDNELYFNVAAELIRVDMEHSWRKGKNKRLVDYQAIRPEVFNHQYVLEQVAYEEYRLRTQAGEQVSPEQYHSQYNIPTDDWARWTPSQNEDQQDALQSNIPELWQEALVLADDVHAFPGVGESFSGFTLDKEIGLGAFSHVFLARQGELAERPVVLKIASGNSLEPQHLARLQHTNIVPIYSVHRQEKLTAVCMPYYGHRTLADLLAVVCQEPKAIGQQHNLISTFLNERDPTELMPNNSLPEDPHGTGKPENKVTAALAESNYVDAVVWLIKQIADGISHAHERGIVHRDLKPANVLMTDEGLPMVLDFNLSEDVVVNGRTSLLVGGTLPYMSPEHLKAVSSGDSVGYQSDIFSLGVIFFELLTGTRPYLDRSGAFEGIVYEMIADRKNGCPTLRDRNPAIPPSIESIVQRCLAPNKLQRYETAVQLSEDLARHLHSEPLIHAPNRSLAERSKKWLRRHPRLTSAGGVAAISACVLALVLGFWTLREHRLARLEAEGIYQDFSNERPALHMALGLPYTDPQLLRDGIKKTRASLHPYALLNEENWRSKQEYQSLTMSDRVELDHRLAETIFLIARANERLIEVGGGDTTNENLASEALRLNQLAMGLYSTEARPQALLQQRARLLDYLEKTDEANQLRQEMAGTSPSTTALDQYAEAYDLLVDHKFSEAEPELVKLRDRYPTDPLSWVLLGDAQVALHQLSEAEGSFTTAIAFNRESYQAYYHRGRCRMDLRQYDEALVDFDRMIALRPRLACGYLNRALVQRALRNYEEAIADLTEALELGATETRIYFLRSKLHRLLGDTAAAESDVETGLELTPSDALSWVSRGVAQLKSDPESALADFQQALKLNPSSSTALHNCVHVYADRLNQPKHALEIVNKLLLLNEKDTDALASRAVLFARIGNREAALQDTQQLLRLSTDPKMLFQAACALSLTSHTENTDADKALTLISQAVQLEPKWFVRAHTDPDLKSLRETNAFQSFATNFRKIYRMKMNLNKEIKPN